MAVVLPDLRFFTKRKGKRKGPAEPSTSISTAKKVRLIEEHSYGNKPRNPSKKRVKEIKTTINQKVLKKQSMFHFQPYSNMGTNYL